MKISIVKKIILGYVPVVVLIFLIIALSLHGLNRVNHINEEIVSVDLVVNKAAEDMIDVLLAQESYCQRYLILKTQDMLSLYWKRDQEFESHLQRVDELPDDKRPGAMLTIAQYHSEYKRYFQAAMQHLDSVSSVSYAMADSLRKATFDSQVVELKKLAADTKQSQRDRTWKTADIGRRTFRLVAIVSVLGSFLAIGIAITISRSIVGSIVTLRAATGLVSQGRFEDLPTVQEGDELGELSLAFNEMAIRLQRLEEMYMDSSPLTHLPGGVAVENSVKTLVDQHIDFAFCMMDLDNFKPFNDRYGYSRGNEVIKHTAELIDAASRELGEPSDFVGHIGGDDFALVTTPQKYEPICKKVIQSFDNDILNYYDEEDRERGCIQSVSRQGEKLAFPIMTISIAALDTEKSHINNHIEVGEIIAELKKYAKSFNTSSFVVDRRGGRRRLENNA